jgi:hypothetical protein
MMAQIMAFITVNYSLQPLLVEALKAFSYPLVHVLP